MTRRAALGVLASIPLAAAFAPLPEGLDAPAVEAASNAAADALASTSPYAPKFFTAREWETVRVLADLVIPRDERSGSATDAGAPEFMDFILDAYPDQQTAMRGGLAWLDSESVRRYGTRFVATDGPSRRRLLDDIAWPARARPEMSQGVAFFSRFRDLTAAGFWSSRIGVADIGYKGNTGMAQWTGCPPEALQKLGVSYGAEGG
ncbi:MAG TPA: gluconate 2-dehydrogenase subunit 3 family protein [Longimicrobium sp.]|nr:gluconate 2-dehydrogenase subunit 3 family protein [Longimicrobium sp.]